MNIGKCSVTRLVKPASATQKGKLSLALDRWRFPIRHRKKQETKALAAWNNRRGTSPKPVAKPLPKSRGIEPFMHLKGKAVSETLSFRVLGHRDNFDLSGRASLEHADTVVSNSLWAVRWVRRNLGSSHALDYAASRVAPAALFAVEAGSTPAGLATRLLATGWLGLHLGWSPRLARSCLRTGASRRPLSGSPGGARSLLGLLD